MAQTWVVCVSYKASTSTVGTLLGCLDSNTVRSELSAATTAVVQRCHAHMTLLSGHQTTTLRLALQRSNGCGRLGFVGVCSAALALVHVVWDGQMDGSVSLSRHVYQSFFVMPVCLCLLCPTGCAGVCLVS